MKKLFFAAAIAAFTFTTGNAQEISYGAKAGVNFASIWGDDNDEAGIRTSFHVGAVVEIAFSEKFSLQPELVYSSQGFLNEQEEDSEKLTETLKSNYLNLPIMLKYYVANGLSIEAGPQIGLLLSAEADGEYTNSDFPELNSSATIDAKEVMNSIDFGLDFGLGYKLENGLNFSARYNLGLSNIREINDNYDFSLKNDVICLGVGFLF